ncbi:MAG TPA: hypothetical protein VIQ30_12755 [Pseudonocardia sp.]
MIEWDDDIEYDTDQAVRSCRVCGCTDDDACKPACWWVAPDLCSTCEVADA